MHRKLGKYSSSDSFSLIRSDKIPSLIIKMIMNEFPNLSASRVLY